MHTQTALKWSNRAISLAAEDPLKAETFSCVNTHRTERPCLQHPEMSHPEDRLADLQKAVALLCPLLLSSAGLVTRVQTEEHADLTALLQFQELVGLEPWQQLEASGSESGALMF